MILRKFIRHHFAHFPLSLFYYIFCCCCCYGFMLALTAFNFDSSPSIESMMLPKMITFTFKVPFSAKFTFQCCIIFAQTIHYSRVCLALTHFSFYSIAFCFQFNKRIQFSLVGPRSHFTVSRYSTVSGSLCSHCSMSNK